MQGTSSAPRLPPCPLLRSQRRPGRARRQFGYRHPAPRGRDRTGRVGDRRTLPSATAASANWPTIRPTWSVRASRSNLGRSRPGTSGRQPARAGADRERGRGLPARRRAGAYGPRDRARDDPNGLVSRYVVETSSRDYFRAFSKWMRDTGSGGHEWSPQERDAVQRVRLLERSLTLGGSGGQPHDSRGDRRAPSRTPRSRSARPLYGRIP